MTDQLIEILNRKLECIDQIEEIYTNGGLKEINSGRNIVAEIEQLDNKFLEVYKQCKVRNLLQGKDLENLQAKVDQVMKKMEIINALEQNFEQKQLLHISETKQKIKNVKVSPRNLEKYKNFPKKNKETL